MLPTTFHVSWLHVRAVHHHGRLRIANHDAEAGVVGVGDELLDAEVPGLGAAEEGSNGGEEEAPVEHDVEAIRRLPSWLEEPKKEVRLD